MAEESTRTDLGNRLVAWERADESAGHSIGRVGRMARGWRCHGTEVLAGPRALLSCWFQVDLDEDWVTREAVVGAVGGAGQRTLTLSADDRRRWTVNGRHDPDLDGCIDIDVAATPLTNTFPVRRLAGLDVGAQVTTPIAWVGVPDLGVTRVDQTYRRLPDVDGLAAWEYRDPQHGPFLLTVDADGLVVTYEGFARRVTTTA
ncbi:MAG TPA: putative glycolipid-binding domain-containing protein [Mycobacteriales bacterium]